MSTNEAELTSLQLLRDMRAELRETLSGLGGREGDGLLQHYRFYSAALINRLVEGYIYLRESGCFDASKLLIRTALEVVFRIHAVRTKPELMFRIAYTEFQEDKKWLRPFKGPDIENALQNIERRWDEFQQAYRAKYPEHPLIKKVLSLRRAAELAGLGGDYNGYYRLYCQFTHAAFRASTGALNDLQVEDNRTMTRCTYDAIEALISVGGSAPNLPELKRRLYSNEESA